MDRWGTLDLKIQAYERVETAVKLNEVNVITDPASDDPQSILMGGGRLRRKRTIQGYATKAEYDSLESDMCACTVKTVIFGDGFTMSAVLSALSSSRNQGSSLVWYSASFMEV